MTPSESLLGKQKAANAQVESTIVQISILSQQAPTMTWAKSSLRFVTVAHALHQIVDEHPDTREHVSSTDEHDMEDFLIAGVERFEQRD